ncbi:PTS mannose transporter subunit IIA [Bacillus sp. RC]|nr:PTS mannose transporter subunit IIA [Bacillus sp. RC]
MQQLTILNEDNVFFGMKQMTKEEAITFAGEHLVKQGYVKDAYIQGMLEREKITNTYIGNGIGIPHGTDNAKKEILQSGIVILHFKDGINYGGETAHLVIGIAGKNNEHLEILSKIAIALSDEDEVGKIINSSTKEELYSYLDEINN